MMLRSKVAAPKSVEQAPVRAPVKYSQASIQHMSGTYFFGTT